MNEFLRFWPGWIILAAILALLWWTWPAAGQEAPRCAPTAELERVLRDRYQEFPWWIGLAGDGSALVLASRADGATWTMYVRRPDGQLACVIATGQDGRKLPDRQGKGA